MVRDVVVAGKTHPDALGGRWKSKLGAGEALVLAPKRTDESPLL